MRNKLLFLLPSIFIFLIGEAEAHCPLCTAGAIVAAGGAAWLGVDIIVIGLFIGAFAVSIGFWISKLIKKKYIPHQTLVIVLVSFITTVIPILPILTNEHDVFPVFISLMGEYGSFLNRTYLINLFLLGSVIGGAIVSSTPLISKNITRLRRKTIPFQGVIITLLSLIIVGVILQVV